MERLRHAAFVAAVLAIACSCLTAAAERFDQKLPTDKQVIHLLNRLTFGPRAGDAAEVRRVGLEKWIDQQLHPEQIAENPVLEAKVQSLDTLKLSAWQIREKYPPNQVMLRPPAFASLPPQDTMRLMNGSIEERLRTLASLDPSVRTAVLGSAPPQVLEGLPEDFRKEADKGRQAEQEERRLEMRRLMPPLNDLLAPAEVRTLRMGTREEKLALINALPPGKRPQVLRALGPEALANIPELRKEALGLRNPQQLVHIQLIDNKFLRAIYS